MKILHDLIISITLVIMVTSMILTNDANALTVKRTDVSGVVLNGIYKGNLTYYGDIEEKIITQPITIKILDENKTIIQSYSIPVSDLDRANGTFIYETHLSGSYPPDNYTIEFSHGNKTIIDSWHPPHVESTVPELSNSSNQAIIKTALAIPELQNWSHDWKYVHMAFLGNNKAGTPDFKWQYAIVDLKTPPNGGLVPCDVGWEAEVTVDMTTMKVVSANYPNMTSQCHGAVVMGGGPSMSDIQTKIDTPLKQFDSGILAKNVKCNSDFQLILKSKDGSPECVKPSTYNILIERGWAKPVQ